MKKRSFVVGIAGIAIGVSLILATQLRGTSATEVPDAVMACVPEGMPGAGRTSKVESIEVMPFEGKVYYLLAVHTESRPTPWNLVVSLLADESCEAPFANPMGDILSYSPFVPLPVGREFALKQMQLAVAEAGGKAQFEEQMASYPETFWTTEQVWAAQQLGIQVPANAKVVEPSEGEANQ